MTLKICRRFYLARCVDASSTAEMSARSAEFENICLDRIYQDCSVWLNLLRMMSEATHTKYRNHDGFQPGLRTEHNLPCFVWRNATSVLPDPLRLWESIVKANGGPSHTYGFLKTGDSHRRRGGEPGSFDTVTAKQSQASSERQHEASKKKEKVRSQRRTKAITKESQRRKKKNTR